ncbi:MAG TPA: hypothetical protein VFE45_16070 [Coriobacteriia bacterium]|nr:hypothetical protein [Coriobacteriia bacterium]
MTRSNVSTDVDVDTGQSAANKPPTPASGTAAALARLRSVPSIGLVLLLIAIWIVAAVLVPRFGSADNMVNILRQSSDLIIAAIGIMFVLIVAGIDLSIGSLVRRCTGGCAAMRPVGLERWRTGRAGRRAARIR